MRNNFDGSWKDETYLEINSTDLKLFERKITRIGIDQVG